MQEGFRDEGNDAATSSVVRRMAESWKHIDLRRRDS